MPAPDPIGPLTPQQALIAQLREGRPWILLVDDDYHITTGLRDILEDTGYRVEIAHSAAEALAQLERIIFSVMVVDYSLPDDNGVNLSRALRPVHPDLQIVLMTGHDQIEIQASERTMRLFAAFLRKPVSVQLITGAIEQAIDRQCDALQLPHVRMVPEPLEPAHPAPVVARPAPASATPLPAPAPLPAPVAAESKGTALRERLGWMALVLFAFGAGWALRERYPLSPTHPPAPEPAETVAAVPAVQATPPVAVEPIVVAKPAEAPPRASKRTRHAKGPRESSAHPPEPLIDPLSRLKTAKAALRAQPGNAEALQTLLEMFKDPAHRLAAIEALSAVGATSPEVVLALNGALMDEQAPIVFAATTALGRIGPAALPAVPQLLAVITERSATMPSAAQAAAEAVARLGPQALTALINALQVPPQRAAAIALLYRMGPEARDALSALSRLTEDAMVGPSAKAAIAEIQRPYKVEEIR
jgi:ActR/RegA family two-component response regulator